MWTLVVAATVALVGIWLVNDAWFALVWRALSGRADGALRRRKAELLGPLTGRVVEIGAGLGSTIQYYGAGVTELTLVEPNTAMHAALRAAAGTSRHAPHTTIVAGGGEALDAVATSSAAAARGAALVRRGEAAFGEEPPAAAGPCGGRADGSRGA